MLDSIQYTNNSGILTKTVTSVSQVIDIQNEIAALQAQLYDFQQSQEVLHTSEIALAIENYQEQLIILQGALS